MKNRVSYAVLGALQIVLVLALWAVNSGGGQAGEVTLELAAPTIFSILETDVVKLPLVAQKVTSFETLIDSLAAIRNRRVYVVFGQKGRAWQPLEVRTQRPGGEAPAVTARVTDVSAVHRVLIRYAKAGSTKQGVWLTALPVRLRPGDRVFVTEANGKVVYVTPYKVYANKVYGKIVGVSRSNEGPYAYRLTLRFAAGGQVHTGSYVWNFYHSADVPAVGSVVNLSFVAQDGSYKVTYVDFNPFWEGTVQKVESGVSLNLDYGAGVVRPPSSAIAQLTELAETSGRVPLVLRAKVARNGQLHPISLVVGSQEIPLSK